MTPSLFARLSPLLDELLELPSEERSSRLAALAEEDPDLHRAALALLAADEQTAGPLEQSAEEFAELVEAEDPLLGTLIGAFSVVSLLGGGGMGKVYLAERADGQFEQRVALKLVKRGMDSDEVMRRFLAERQILARLEHPHIARLLDGGLAPDGRPYFAMELIAGEPITRFASERKLTVAARIALFDDACQAVEHAHRNLVVHRDLKPSNILVTAQGEVKLLDFGIAKLLGGELGALALTEDGHHPMTPEYAAPEQILGEPVTTATDIFALGLVLYELLTGTKPFAAAGRSRRELEQAILAGNPERPSTAARRARAGTALAAEHLHRRLAGDLDAIVLRAMAREAERRYASVAALRDDLARHRAGLPIAAHPDSLGYRLRKFGRRHRLGVAAGAISSLSLIAGLIGTAWQARLARSEAAKQTAIKDFVVSLFEVSDPDVSKGREISAKELLDRGAERVTRELAAMPQVEAEMLGLVGDLYRKLGLYDESSPLLAEELALRRELGDEPELVASLLRLGELRENAGELEEAERLLAEALGLSRARFGPAAPETSRAAAALGVVIARRGRFDEAGALFEQALAKLVASGGEHSADYANLRNAQGELAASRGDFETAASCFEEALARRRALYGERHSRVAKSLANLAAARSFLGDEAGALTLAEEALRLDRELYGAEHPEVAKALSNLGMLHKINGDLPLAERLLREALAMRERLLGSDNPELAVSHYTLGALLQLEGKNAEALPHLERSLALHRQQFGAGHAFEEHIQKTLDEARAGAAVMPTATRAGRRPRRGRRSPPPPARWCRRARY